MMKGTWQTAGLALLLAGLVALGYWWQAGGGEPPPAVNLACADLAAGCAGPAGPMPVTIGLAGDLKPLQPFQVWVRAPDADAVEASFAMVGMNMGFNLYTLRRDPDGVFRTRVILPVCVSGRRDWVMTVTVDRDTRLAVPFATSL
jgi:hypothetical protein